MSFSKFRNRLCLYNNIIKNDDSVLVACVNCFLLFRFCIMMKNHPKCAECVRRNRLCVDASWENLDRTRNKLKSNIIVIENELARALIKLTRLKKTLKYIKFKIAEKFACLTQKLIDDNDDVSNDENSFVFFDNLSPDFWQFFIFSAEIFSKLLTVRKILDKFSCVFWDRVAFSFYEIFLIFLCQNFLNFIFVLVLILKIKCVLYKRLRVCWFQQWDMKNRVYFSVRK